MLSDILAANVDENRVKLLINNYFMIGVVVIFVVGKFTSVYTRTKLFPLKSILVSAVKCRLFSYKRQNSADDL